MNERSFVANEVGFPEAIDMPRGGRWQMEVVYGHLIADGDLITARLISSLSRGYSIIAANQACRTSDCGNRRHMRT
jgi:hypothetical protein